MLLLVASNIASLNPVRVEVRATASIRIERPAIANSKAWEESPKSSRRVIIVDDEHGRPILVRVIEYQ
jgi:hypothetical protein